MRVIVTGGSGFVGSHTIPALKKRGYDVLNYDLTEGYDIRNWSQLSETIQPGDKILHLAAIARFEDADKDPIVAFETDAVGTKNVAEVASIKQAERVVYSSTGSVYMPIKKDPPITEKFKACGNSVYGCAKYMGELYLQQANIPHVILRYAHLYGEGKLYGGAIANFIKRMNRGLAPELYGGKQSADFTYIKDIVRANIRALKTRNINQVYNIGSGQELSVKEVYDILCDIFDYHVEYKKLNRRIVDSSRFVYDLSKAKKLLKYKPKYTFKKGMKNWYDTRRGFKNIKN